MKPIFNGMKNLTQRGILIKIIRLQLIEAEQPSLSLRNEPKFRPKLNKF